MFFKKVSKVCVCACMRARVPMFLCVYICVSHMILWGRGKCSPPRVSLHDSYINCYPWGLETSEELKYLLVEINQGKKRIRRKGNI